MAGTAIQLSDHFTYGKLIRFTVPSIGMMVFTSIYGVVDGFFVSNYAGSTPFAAVNLIMPFLMIFSALGFMVGTGGTALVSMYLGQGERKKANSVFSLLVYLVIVVGILMTVFGIAVLEKVALALGATQEMLPYCVVYGRIVQLALIPFMLQSMFQSFLVAAERPGLGFVVTVLAGVTNMVLDMILVGTLSMGVIGAALATAFSQIVGGAVPLVYFILPNSSQLRLGKAEPDSAAVIKTCSNGASEFMTSVSISAVSMLYNLELLKYAGENGVSAYGVVMYVCFIFISIYIGYSIGTAPLIGYQYGAGNHSELKNLFQKSLLLIGIFCLLLTAASEALSGPLARLYVGYDRELMELTIRAFRLYSVAFLIMGFNIFGSSFFTALNNGKISAGISFLRTLVFQVLSVLILPHFLGIDGIWLAVVVAEGLSIAVTVYLWIRNAGRYHYA